MSPEESTSRRTGVERPDEEEHGSAAIRFTEGRPQKRTDTVSGDEDGDEENADLLADLEVGDDGRNQVRGGGGGEGCGVETRVNLESGTDVKREI